MKNFIYIYNMDFQYVDLNVKTIRVKNTNETVITPSLLTINNGSNTLSLTASSLSSDGPFTISNATLGSTTGVTVTSTDNSTNLATTAFVKAQLYLTAASLVTYATISSLAEYTKLSLAQTWSALQTFSSGIATNLINATTTTSAMTIGSNLTTGTVTVGTSTSSTTLNGNTTINSLSAPITPVYSFPVSSGKIGEIITATSGTVNASANTNVTIVSLSIPPGVWSITAHTLISSTGTSTYSIVSITTGSVTDDTKLCHKQSTGTNFNTNINLTVFVTNQTSANVTWNLVGQMGISGNFTNNRMLAVRIA